MNTENENTADNKEKNFNRVNVSTELYQIFEQGTETLRKRNVDVSFQKFSSFIITQLPKNVHDLFVEENTPQEFHLNQMMNDPEYKKEFIKLAERLRSKNAK